MNILAAVNPFTKYLYAGAALALAAGLALSHLTAYRAGRHSVQTAWDAATVATERASQEQAARMRDLQRQSELRYTVAAEARERFIVTTVREIRDAAAPLSACPVPAGVIELLNAARKCAVENGCAGVTPTD